MSVWQFGIAFTICLVRALQLYADGDWEWSVLAAVAGLNVLGFIFVVRIRARQHLADLHDLKRHEEFMKRVRGMIDGSAGVD